MSDQTGVSDSTQANSVQTETRTANDVVKYETYSKVLSEAKKLKEKVKEYETVLQQSQEQKLKEQNEWKALAEQYKSKLDQTSHVLQEQEKSIVNGLKFHEFEKHLGGKLKDKEYATFVEFDRIVLNPETKQVDEDSVKTVAADFIKKHASLVEFQGSGKLPNQAAKNYVPMGKSVSDMTSDELQKHILQLAAIGKIK
jgi:hypothetical protein